VYAVSSPLAIWLSLVPALLYALFLLSPQVFVLLFSSLFLSKVWQISGQVTLVPYELSWLHLLLLSVEGIVELFLMFVLLPHLLPHLHAGMRSSLLILFAICNEKVRSLPVAGLYQVSNVF
jgi:hypothetical protein